MIQISLKEYKNDESCQKNVLYKITETGLVRFTEEHEYTKELVLLYYDLKENEYGIYAYEYKRPGLLKDNCKTADVLSCVVNEKMKKVFTLIFDVKSNISSFSDDLTRDNALLVAIKEVRDFAEQIHSEILHKNSFMLYYYAEGYEETEQIGIVTKNFDERKFVEAATVLEKEFVEKNDKVIPLVQLKLKNNLRPYLSEAGRLRQFAERKIDINGKIYDLQVYLLNKKNDAEYSLSINASDGTVLA